MATDENNKQSLRWMRLDNAAKIYPAARRRNWSNVFRQSVTLTEAVDTAVQMNLEGDHGIPVPDYVEENVSTKVVKIIQSYTGVVDKMVWRKETV